MGPITRPLAMTWKATGQMDCEVWLFYWYLSLPKTPLADHQRNKTCLSGVMSRIRPPPRGRASFHKELNFAWRTSTRLVLHSHLWLGCWPGFSRPLVR